MRYYDAESSKGDDFLVMKGKLLSYTEEKNRFLSMSKDASFEEYITLNKGIIYNKIYSVNEYADKFTPKEKFPSNISIENFDEIVSDKYGFWNYPLSETDEIIENSLNTVLVEFSSGEFRLVEIE